MTREEHISNLETIGCDGWTVTTEAYKSLQFAIKALKQEPCEDAISREYILSKAHCCCDDLADDEPCCVDVDDIKNAPSVQPIRPKGEWIETTVRGSKSLVCSKCGADLGSICETNFCPTCGADIRESEENVK